MYATMDSHDQYVRLNVGGHLYMTSLSTLTRRDSMLSAMFSGAIEPRTDSEGFVNIDRDGALFGYILNFLRDDRVYGPQTSSSTFSKCTAA
jgi:BTB/POZ domain-containing adapter for CUL3-mediated RhoA degradation protein